MIPMRCDQLLIADNIMPCVCCEIDANKGGPVKLCLNRLLPKPNPLSYVDFDSETALIAKLGPRFTVHTAF